MKRLGIMKVDSYIVLSDVIVLARPMREPGECESGGVLIQFDTIKKS
jgi:hypothetical protein